MVDLTASLRSLWFNHVSRRTGGKISGPPTMDLDGTGRERLRQSLTANFYAWQIPGLHGISHLEFLSSEAGRQDMAHHVESRLFHFRTTIMPWLGTVMDLASKEVLEIGAGTGASTVAFAGACRRVHAVDIDPAALRVARDRARLHGLRNVTVEAMNGTSLGRLQPTRFDLVAYIATLEHMTYAERLRSLGLAWALLKPGGFMIVVDTPNRLWFFDGHTGMLPFFHWLPDELAIACAAHAPRADLAAAFAKPGREPTTKLARWGRGVSYHEFHLAIGAERMEVVSSLPAYRRATEPGAQEWWDQHQGGRYQALIREAAPDIPLPFLEDGLNLALRKL